MTLDFSAITAANDNPNFKIRITLSGATASTGNNRFDNFRVFGNSISNNLVNATLGANAAEPSTNGFFNINLTNPAPAGGVTVTYTLGGTATIGADYTNPENGTVTIPAGSTTGVVNIIVVDDLISEPDETVVLTLQSANNGFIVSTATATMTITDNDITAGVIGFVYDFNTCSNYITQGFRQYSVTGAQAWSCNKQGRTYTTDPSTDSAIDMNGFQSGYFANEDWLISPPYNLTTANAPLLKFYSKTGFSGAALQLKVSTNYSGFGDPNAATWANLNGNFPAANSNAWTLSDSINLSAYNAPNVYIAWVYTSTNTVAARWTLDDISVRASCFSPTNQPTALNLTPGINFINGSFTAAAPGSVAANGYLVVASTSNTLTDFPSSGTTYAIDDAIGNGVVVYTGSSTSFTANNLQPSTPYYLYIFSFNSSQTCYNTTGPLTGNISTNSPPSCTPPSQQATNLQASNITGSSMTISYLRGNGDNVLVLAHANTTVNQNPITGVDYPLGSQVGSGNFVVYKGPASNFNYSSLSPNTAYYFAVYEYGNVNTCYNLTPLTGSFITSCVTPANVNSLNATPGNARVTLSWANPINAACYDEVFVVASNAPIPGVGSDYTGSGNSNYTSPNQVVYRGTGTSVLVTGLTNATLYHFKVFTKKGTSYSTGVSITSNPYDPAAGYMYLYGNLHSHSSYSDGNKDNLSKKPKDDYRFARDGRCMDFLGISEHNHAGAGMNISNYPLGYADANLVNGEVGPTGNSIVTLWGMEWGVISNGGHALVYGFNEQLIGWEAGNYNIFCAKSDYGSLWPIINAQPNAFATLAHPGSGDYNSLSSSAYSSTADNAIVGTAVESGPAFSTDTTYGDYPSPLAYFSYYRNLLAKGYHVGAQIDGDNHNLTFGRQSGNRMVVLSVSKSRSDLVSAIKALRFYASNDCNARVDFKLYGNVMGSSITRAGLPSITISATDPDVGDGVDSIFIYGGKVGSSAVSAPIKRYGTASVLFDATDAENLQPDNTTYYYYALVKQTDGNKILTSPIWYTRNDAAVPVTLLNLKASYNQRDNTVNVYWNTSQEINSKEFVVERSIDNGATFTALGKVAAAGTSSVLKAYEFTDLAPVNGTNLYRLNQVDIDQLSRYSQVVSANTKGRESNYFSLYPNLTNNFTYVHSTSATPKMVIIDIVDAAGRILRREKGNIVKDQPMRLDIKGLKSGVYFIRIDAEGERSTSKLIVQ